MRNIALALLAAIALLGAAPEITVVINGDKLLLDPPPFFEKDVLYVPVRRTIEALGLPFDRSGKQVSTQVGARTVIVEPTVEIKNVLFAPLRFFSDSLGAQVRFDTRAHTVTMTAQLIGRTSGGLMATRSGYTRIGTVSAVDVLSDPPTITLAYDTGPKTISIARNATVDMEDVDADVTTPGELGDVRPGDFARVEMRKDGRVEKVVDEFGSHFGKIVAVGGGQVVLEDGQVIASTRTTEVALNGRAASFSDLLPGDHVSVRYNVETNEVREVLASRAAVQQTAGSSATADDDATRPLQAGDTVHVDIHGPPGGSATFDLGSYVSDIAMQETSPGIYAGSYTIPRGANFSSVPVIGHVAFSGRAPVDAVAAQTVSASSSPPGISAVAPDPGATVNSSKPGIYAAFAAGAVGVNPSTAILWVNGRDVTAECVRTAQFIQYLPSYSYPNGPVRVAVRVADRAGNVTTKSWTFTVKAR